MSHEGEHGEVLIAPDSFREACATIGIEVSEAEVEGLGRYLYLLLERNKQFNLTAIREPDVAWMRHVLDSLSMLAFLEPARRVVGSGAYRYRDRFGRLRLFALGPPIRPGTEGFRFWTKMSRLSGFGGLASTT